MQRRDAPQGIDLWQTHLNRKDLFSPPLFPRKEKGVLSRGHTGVPNSSKESFFFEELRLFKGIQTLLKEKSFLGK